MSSVRHVALDVAQLLLAGPLEPASVRARMRGQLGRCPRWLSSLVKRIVEAFGVGSRPTVVRIAGFIVADADFRRAFAAGRVDVGSIRRRTAPEMVPAAGAPEKWNVPAVTSMGELASRLRLGLGELEWFADIRLLNPRSHDPKLRHYVARWKVKSDGSARLIESPKPRLKGLQRLLLEEIIDRIPPHGAVHGFRKGRSIRSFVEDHAGRAVVVRLDLKDFFTHVTRARVFALFRAAGYPEPVALRLAGLCTTGTSREVMARHPSSMDAAARHQLGKRLEIPHLPQGAPTSPALANLAAFRLDCRLDGLARAAEAHYTRYADDLVFSGGDDFRRCSGRFIVAVGAIALEEGFEVNMRKTRIMPRGVSQRAAGLVLNHRANLPREQFDRLKAILHNAARRGPSTQNRAGHPDFRAHLLGRVAYVESVHPGRGARLRRLFESVDWSQPPGKVADPACDTGN